MEPSTFRALHEMLGVLSRLHERSILSFKPTSPPRESQRRSRPATAGPFGLLCSPLPKERGLQEALGGAVRSPHPPASLSPRPPASLSPLPQHPSGQFRWALRPLLAAWGWRLSLPSALFTGFPFSLARNTKFLREGCLVVACPHLVPAIIIVL